MRLIVGIFILFCGPFAFSSNQSETLMAEYTALKSYVQSQKSDGVIGGFYNYLQKDGYIIMYSKYFDGEYETIRLFLEENENNRVFAVTYKVSPYIYDGRLILRRTVGPEPTGWRNDTIDLETGEYLGSQGTPYLSLSSSESKLLKTWNIKLF